MNDKIYKLWDMANTRWTIDYLLSGKPREEWRSVPDMFAELIVKECAELMYGRDENGNCKDGDVIKKHFGVEE